MFDPIIEPFDFALTPKGYECGECRQSGVKLWRVAASSDIQLFCVVCVCKRDDDADPSLFDDKGMWTSLRSYFLRTDQVGGCVPAVPCEDGSGWYGYTSIPEDGVRWWERLPTLGERQESRL